MAKVGTLFLRKKNTLALTLALLITPVLFASDYFYVDDTMAPLASVSDLVDTFLERRAQFETMMPPDINTVFYQPSWPAVLASRDSFPPAFTNGLIGVDQGGCRQYPVTCIQVRSLNRIVFLNAAGQVFATASYTDDSIWNRTAWSDDDYDLQSRDPARVGLTLYLVTPADLAAADEAAELQAEIDAATAVESDAAGGGLSRIGGMQSMHSMQSLLDKTYMDLFLAGIQPVTNGMELTIGLPDGWTNRLDVLVSGDLGPFVWRWLARLDDATNGVSFTWDDTNTTTRGFYVLGNADRDSDGDGLSDAIEIYVTKTSPTNPDTDGDGISDWDEVNLYRTDPNNPDTTPPAISLQEPANGTRIVWMP